MEPSISRIEEMITSVGTIGFVPDQGTTRLAYSQEYRHAVRELIERMDRVGISTRVDSVGNLYAWLDGPGKSIVIGSHLDTVPNGGMFDGALGVMVGLECLVTLKQNGYSPKHRIEVIGFTEEEGNVIGGTFGSRCVAGLPQEQNVLDLLSSVGLSLDAVKAAARDKNYLCCYLELHIEQGGLLETEGKTIGIVDGIVGIRRYMLTIDGQANHAGATPMHLRDDALVKAAGIICAFDNIVKKHGDDLVGTIGRIYNYPNAINVIPNKVELAIELRSIDPKLIDSAMADLTAYTNNSAADYELFLDERETLMEPRICDIIEQACISRGYGHMHMSSGAGHDAISMARIAPSGMIFVPSIGGISHSIKERSDWQDIEKGAAVLMDTLLMIDSNGLCQARSVSKANDEV